MIRAAVGKSTQQNSARAALEAAAQIGSTFDGARPDWCVAFFTPAHAQTMTAMLESLSEAVGTPYVVGCSGSGVLVPGWEIEDGPGLAVLAVQSDQIRATPFLFQDDGDHGMTAGVRVGQRLVNSRNSEDLLLVWPDPFAVRPDRFLQSLDAVLGQVPVVGGAASGRGRETVQFCGNEFGASSVSGMRLGGKFHHVVGVTQGCRPLGDPLCVTRAHENLILELDGESAYAVLKRQAPPGLLDDLEWGLNFLFVGLLPEAGGPDDGSGEYLVRNIVEADPDTGVMAIAEPVEEGQRLLLAHREGKAAEADLLEMLERVSPEKTGLNYRCGFYFNCLARGRSLYGEEGKDSALLKRVLPDVPIVGFFCNAEIGPLRGVNRLFTYTGVLLLIAE